MTTDSTPLSLEFISSPSFITKARALLGLARHPGGEMGATAEVREEALGEIANALIKLKAEAAAAERRTIEMRGQVAALEFDAKCREARDLLAAAVRERRIDRAEGDRLLANFHDAKGPAHLQTVEGLKAHVAAHPPRLGGY